MVLPCCSRSQAAESIGPLGGGADFFWEETARRSGPRGDQAFDGDDHGEGLDLGGNAVAGHFGVQVGDFPEAGQDLLAAQVQPAQFLRLLLDELLFTAARCSSM